MDLQRLEMVADVDVFLGSTGRRRRGKSSVSAARVLSPAWEGQEERWQ